MLQVDLYNLVLNITHIQTYSNIAYYDIRRILTDQYHILKWTEPFKIIKTTITQVITLITKYDKMCKKSSKQFLNYRQKYTFYEGQKQLQILIRSNI